MELCRSCGTECAAERTGQDHRQYWLPRARSERAADDEAARRLEQHREAQLGGEHRLEILREAPAAMQKEHTAKARGGLTDSRL